MSHPYQQPTPLITEKPKDDVAEIYVLRRRATEDLHMKARFISVG